MEVVCLILGPTLTSQPFSHAFWVLTSLHLPSFFIENVFIILSLLGFNHFVVNPCFLVSCFRFSILIPLFITNINVT